MIFNLFLNILSYQGRKDETVEINQPSICQAGLGKRKEKNPVVMTKGVGATYKPTQWIQKRDIRLV